VRAATGVDRADLVQKARAFPAGAYRRWGGIALVLGAATLVWGLMGDGQRAARVWQAWHFNFLFWNGLALSGVAFATTQKLAKGHWSGLVIRFAEASVAFSVVGVVLFAVEFFGRSHIYTWIHEPRPDIGGWLTSGWFFIRNTAVLAVLAWLAWRFVRRDVAPDVRELAEGRPVDRLEDAAHISRDAAIFLIAWAFGMSLLGFDLVTSLAHKWVSNLYGAFYFMGSFLAALMALAVTAIAMRRAMGLGELYSPKQQHDLGKLCFGFSVFWAYLMWSQFLVIWYGNLPEETYFIFYRLWGAWRPVGIAVFVLIFLIPFIGLLGEKPKKFVPTMTGFALVSLIGIWLERYLEVVPSINGGAGPAIGLPELGITALFGGLYLLAIAWFAGKYPMLSPRLAADTLEREHHH
jgi:hypothetical protein